MSDISAFLLAPTPELSLAPSRRKKPSGIGAKMAPIIDALSEMDPYTAEFTRQMYNGMFQQVGIPIEIPDVQSFQMNQLMAEKKSLELRRQIAEEKVGAANAFMADLTTEQKMAWGITTDNLLEEDPERFVHIVSDKLGFPIKKSDLVLAGIEDSSADAKSASTEKKAKKEAEGLSRQASELSNIESIAKYGDVFADEAEQAVKNQETDGIDLFTMDTDTDEPAGARAVFQAYDKFMRNVPQDLKPKAVASFVKLMGSDMADSLEEAPVDENGSLVFGAGNYDADPEAIYYLGALINRMARDRGDKDGSGILAALGVSANQLDMRTASEMAKLISTKYGETFEQHRAAFWGDE